jgi:hypothetical protein
MKDEKGIIIDKEERVNKIIYVLLPLYAITIWAIPIFVFSLIGISNDPVDDIHTDLITNHLLPFGVPSENSGTERKDGDCAEAVSQKERRGKKRMKLFLVILSGFLLLACSKAWGAEWKYCGQTSNASYFYNLESMIRQEKVVKMWVKAVYSKDGRLNEAEKLGGENRNLTDSIALEEIDCRDQSRRTLALIVHSMEGKVIISDSEEFNQDFTVPAAILKSFYRTECK